ncbi:Transcriptional regulator [Roseobacter sp. SK209-2-6]|uniref:TetR/AcrR family transcriptional regulator n=1 Tax=Roseobacter sp. SK209-2-6 TaxID=388739 RepID=UPI0000F3CDAE|nr:TetR/AcrR family transcriptional regulator [Roseobacter sp. SK209-2-6]EBA14803.1 Transcriptional regulator [Roseobacter sp. SK209-2-6]
MPYSKEHKDRTRSRITEAARILFNVHGYHGVTIDMVMAGAGLTRGGFYNHFQTKEQLFAAAVASFLMGKGAEWRDDAGIDPSALSPQMAAQMVDSYLSARHLGALQDQCPMIALPSDVARASPEVRAAYQDLLQAMTGLFQASLTAAEREDDPDLRQRALALSALCVGGMVIARTLPDSDLASEIRAAAHACAMAQISAV